MAAATPILAAPVAAAALGRFSAATLHEALGRRGALPARIRPIDRSMRLCGPALPVFCPEGDNLVIHAAIEAARPGDVLVIDNEASGEFGPFGDVLALACRLRGVAGLVIDGCVRDAAELRRMEFPVFSRGLCIRGTGKAGGGWYGAPITLGGVTIAPGDVVAGDEDGVVVVPAAEAASLVAKAQAREAAETELRRALEAGAVTVDLLGLRDRLSGIDTP